MYIDKSKKIVIKIGSSILINKKGKPKKSWLKEFAKDIKLLINKKKQVRRLRNKYYFAKQLKSKIDFSLEANQ